MNDPLYPWAGSGPHKAPLLQRAANALADAWWWIASLALMAFILKAPAIWRFFFGVSP